MRTKTLAPTLSAHQLETLRETLVEDAIFRLEVFHAPRWAVTRRRLKSWAQTLKRLQAAIEHDEEAFLSDFAREETIASVADAIGRITAVERDYPRLVNHWEGKLIETAMEAYVRELFGEAVQADQVPFKIFEFSIEDKPVGEGAQLVCDVWDNVRRRLNSIRGASPRTKGRNNFSRAFLGKTLPENDRGDARMTAVKRVLRSWRKRGRVPQSGELAVLVGEDRTWID